MSYQEAPSDAKGRKYSRIKEQTVKDVSSCVRRYDPGDLSERPFCAEAGVRRLSGREHPRQKLRPALRSRGGVSFVGRGR